MRDGGRGRGGGGDEWGKREGRSGETEMGGGWGRGKKMKRERGGVCGGGGGGRGDKMRIFIYRADSLDKQTCTPFASSPRPKERLFWLQLYICTL